jgi:hypothetical protein
MAHAQKPDFVFRRNGRVHFFTAGASVQSTTGRRAVRISLQGLYCSCKPVFCSHVTLTGYPLHSLIRPSLLHPCATVCHHISTGLYNFASGRVRIVAKSANNPSNPSVRLTIRLSACIRAAPRGQTSIKFDIGVFHENVSSKSTFG